MRRIIVTPSGDVEERTSPAILQTGRESTSELMVSTPQNVVACRDVSVGHPPGLVVPGGPASSHHPGSGHHPAPGPDSESVHFNLMKQTNNLEFLQQQVNIAMATYDPQIIAEAYNALTIARGETQAVRDEAQSVIRGKDAEL